jgi:L-aminopeptidase/D-esterase-like protein
VETFDGYMIDIGALAVQPSDIVYGLENASADEVKEGNVERYTRG